MFWAAFRIASEDLVLGGVSGGCVKREDRSVKMAEGGNKEGSDSRHGPKAEGEARVGVDEPHSPLRENTGSSFLPRIRWGISQNQRAEIPTSRLH